jgi:hypothetical protein
VLHSTHPPAAQLQTPAQWRHKSGFLKLLSTNQRMRIGVLKGVAWGPSVETGANVPSYSGGLAVWWWFRMRDAGIFCSWGR